MQKMILDRMVGHDVKLAFEPTMGKLADLDVAPHKVAFVLKPLGDELFYITVRDSDTVG